MTTAIDRLRAYADGTSDSRPTRGDALGVVAEVDALRKERDRLRGALVDTINAIGNGSAASPECSTEFLVGTPAEVRAACGMLRAELDRRHAELLAALDWQGGDWRSAVLAVAMMRAAKVQP